MSEIRRVVPLEGLCLLLPSTRLCFPRLWFTSLSRWALVMSHFLIRQPPAELVFTAIRSYNYLLWIDKDPQEERLGFSLLITWPHKATSREPRENMSRVTEPRPEHTARKQSGSLTGSNGAAVMDNRYLLFPQGGGSLNVYKRDPLL